MKISTQYIEKYLHDRMLSFSSTDILALHFSDSFYSTRMSSYFRFAKIMVQENAEIESLLLWVLSKENVTSPYPPIGTWLPNCEFKSADIQDLNNMVTSAKDDFNEESAEDNSKVKGLEFPINENVTNKYIRGYISHLHKESNKNISGPTNIAIWQTDEAYYYLEIYNGS